MTLFKLLIDTLNPAVTPVTAENLWTCAHFRVDRVSNEITTMSSHTNPSWEIVSAGERAALYEWSGLRRIRNRKSHLAIHADVSC
jgi:hypothetical protein